MITSDPEVVWRIRDSRLLGVKNDTEKRLASDRSWEFDVTEQGYRYHMSNLFAAVGRVQLTRPASGICSATHRTRETLQKTIGEYSWNPTSGHTVRADHPSHPTGTRSRW